MKEIILNSDLEQSDIYTSDIDSFIKYSIKVTPVRTVIEGRYLHYSFIEYLKMAYDFHKGIIIKPDFIWHTVLYELSQLIKDNPDTYREFFTKEAEEKVKIIVPTNDPQLIDLNLIINDLNDLVPVGTQDFLLDFTTSDIMSRMAINAAFCDAVSPFYDYGMFLCGLPKMKILGTEEDWSKIRTALINLKPIFKGYEYYFEDMVTVVDKFVEGTDIEFLSQVFNSQSEGSGSKLFIGGWVKHLFIDNKIQKFKECPRQVSKVDYKFLNTGQNFKMHVGLFSSELDEDDYLVPQYGYVIEELDAD